MSYTTKKIPQKVKFQKIICSFSAINWITKIVIFHSFSPFLISFILFVCIFNILRKKKQNRSNFCHSTFSLFSASSVQHPALKRAEFVSVYFALGLGNQAKRRCLLVKSIVIGQISHNFLFVSVLLVRRLRHGHYRTVSQSDSQKTITQFALGRLRQRNKLKRAQDSRHPEFLHNAKN